jgi:DNA (cytosine-5)-methyltransferase 1
MTAYYNEIDPYAAQWLRNLIAAGHIAQGEVDERSIEDIKPDDLMGYTQCHFFAGIGVWSHALRLAGWPDDRPVWTGSCPCQPFSSAGKGAGFADERHLWPAFFHLISQCRPPVVFGEQVASKDGLAWLDLVQADLEGAGYASGAADLCAAGIGAPHIRQRLYWVANAGCELQAEHGSATGKRKQHLGAETRDFGCGGSGGLDNNNNTGLERHRADQTQSGWIGEAGSVATAGKSGGLADNTSVGREVALQHAGSVGSTDAKRQADVAGGGGASDRPAPTNGHWRDADWLYCRDGKWRPVEPGTFPLAYGATARVGRLRAYGNAIVPQVAQTFIEVYLDQQVEHGVLL